MEAVITLKHVSMKFNLSKDKVDSLKEYTIRLLKRKLFYDEFWALKDVSLTIAKGEIWGLVGLNGAGKSTLLKLIAGVLKPTEVTVQVRGRIAPLIELGAGFDPDLTAKENVFMNGAVLGYSTQYMKQHYKAIMDFAELWDFEDVPVKNFSSGMYARLGFSIATTVQADILIVDEILGVGDFKFQEKCQQRIHELMTGGTTVIMVSHDDEVIKKYCQKVAWIRNGELIAVGNAENICNRYLSE